jgi:hypothetical protein
MQLLMPAVRRLRAMVFGRVTARIGGSEVADARLLADAERVLGDEPAGCAWLDARTIDDLDLPFVFRSIDRAATPTGAQLLWRWLTAPATRRDVLDTRERKLTMLDPELREQITERLADTAAVDAPCLPRLLWQEPRELPSARLPIALLAAVAACAVLAWWWPAFVAAVIVLGVAAVLLDTYMHQRLAEEAHALAVLGATLDTTARIVAQCRLPAELAGDIAADLAVRARLRKRLLLLTARDPLDLLEVVRAALLVRLLAIRSCMRMVDVERARLRRIVLWLGELDALCSVARLRAERDDAHVPAFEGTQVTAGTLVHPAVPNAIGNEITLAPALLVTGSNMSGKSTLLRAVAVNAILAQSVHTTFGRWRAPLVRVRSVMQIRDDVEHGMSTYAVEVAAIGELVAATGGALPTLFVLDEPFHGTNPAVRVPIVVAVLEHLAAHDFVIAATHDLDVARQLGEHFVRGYFAQLPNGDFDRTLKPGVALSTNALELLTRAGYPPALLARVEQHRTAG